jgi:SAM-dependent methyltransferase
MSELLKNTYSINAGVVIPGQSDLLKQAISCDFRSVLDIGAGNLAATNFFQSAGKKCTATINNAEFYSPLILNDVKIYRDIDVEKLPFMMEKFDAVWCAHVLEHTLNPGQALLSIRKKIRRNGILFLMGPPFKHSVVGGHLSVGWNLGILMYFLILCGFDVKNGSFIRHGYNLAAFVRRGELPSVRLNNDAGDIELLSDYFPSCINASQGFDGNLSSVNWEWKCKLSNESEN